MTNRMTALLACLLCSLVASAQIEFGVKAGLTTESLQEERFDLSREGREDLLFALEDANYGFQFGALLRIPLSDRFAIVPEVTFNSSSYEYRLDDQDDGSMVTQIFKETYQDINVPLLASWRIAFLRFQAGPVGHFFLNSKSDLMDPDGRERTFDSFNLGYAIGGAIDIGPIVIDLRYDGNFAKYGNEFTVAGETFEVDQAPRRWIATVGYLF